MTAVVQPFPRNGWSSGQTDLDMSADDVSRMFVPRKSAQRQPSSSSLASSASSTSTVSTVSPDSSQPNGLTNGETAWATRKKPSRGIWPASSKAEPVASLSTARTQSVPANASGPSAASAISALHAPSPQQQQQQQQQQQPQPQPTQNGLTMRSSGQLDPQVQAQLHLQPLNGTFERKAIKIPFAPDLVRIGRQTNNKTIPTPDNGYFDSKVLSRQHAEVWADRQGHVWIRDVKSSNGTFVNGKRLSQENRDSDPHPLKEADVLELGIDIVSEDQKTVVHHKVAARVDHAGLFTPGPDLSDYSDSDLALPNGVNVQHINQNGRGRPPGQGPNAGNGRFAGAGVAMSNVPAPAYQSKWLQPVTMEQIVKRLNNELKSARMQSSSVRQSSNYVKAVNAGEQPLSPHGISLPPSTRSLDRDSARLVSVPPQLPPLQPPPEAPSEAPSEAFSEEAEREPSTNDEPTMQPLLRRSDTARPRITNASPDPPIPLARAEQSSQVLNLLEALAVAQKEIATQSEKLTEMEAALIREREERKVAEERATKLQSDSSTSCQDTAVAQETTNGTENGADGQSDISGTDTASLQQCIDLMRAEMSSMRAQMESYRQRAESAEEESQRDRTTLAEMVDSIRKREEAAKRRMEKKKKAKKEDGQSTEQWAATDYEDKEVEKLDEELGKELARAESRLLAVHASMDGIKHAQNGNSSNHHMSIAELQQLGKAAMAAAMDSENKQRGVDAEGDASQLTADRFKLSTQKSRRQEQLAQTAPYASMLGVILLGVGLMAYLNGWQKVADR